MKRIDWFIVALVSLILLLIASGAAGASWDQPQTTLTPGTWQVVEFANDGSESVNLVVVNISAPDVLLPYIVVTPGEVAPLSSENITIQFAYVPISVRQSIPKDVFAVQISGLLVYLDLSVPLPENAENRWAEIEARIVALEASVMAQFEGAVVRIVALESAPGENWTPLIENLREDTAAKIENLRTEMAELWASIPESNPATDKDWFVELLDNKEAEIRMAIGNDIANLEIDKKLADADKKLADAKSENEELRYVAYAAIAIAIVTAAIAIRRPKFGKPSLRPQQRRFEEISLGDKIVMLENEISAMRERGDSEDSIKEKERELWELRRQLKPKKRRKKNV